MLIDGKSYRDIAEHFGVSLGTVHNFTSKDEHSARVREARMISASTFDDKAEEVLRDETLEFARARELASHYRWRASKRKPKEYGDKLDVTSDGEKINTPPPAINIYNGAPPLASSEDEVS